MNPVNFVVHHVHHVHRAGQWRHACLGWLLALSAHCAVAQDAGAPSAPASTTAAALTPEGLSSRYPSGSIQSTDIANRALAEVEQQRNALDQRYAAEQHVCYSKFFATSCLDAASERRRSASAQIRQVEVEANTYLRSARVVERDQNLAEKRAQEANNPPKPLAETTTKPIAAPRSGDGAQRLAAHEAKLQQVQQDEKANAQKRADNVAAFEKKARDAEARQRDVAAKKAEKEQQAAAKAAASTPP